MIAILNEPPRHVCECGCAKWLEAKFAELKAEVEREREHERKLMCEIQRLETEVTELNEEVKRLGEAGQALYHALRHATARDAPVEILREWRDAILRYWHP